MGRPYLHAGPLRRRVRRPFGDGAAYAPGADRWRPIPAPPLAPRIRASSIWTGTEMLVWGGQAGTEFLADGAACDPAADRWWPIPTSPLSGRVLAAMEWTGTELLVWGGQAQEYLADGAAYNPATGSWRALAPSPLAPWATRGF